MNRFNDPFYVSQEWIQCRKAYAKSVGGLCERCKEKGLITAGEIVHHKRHLTPNNITDPNITLNWDNLMLVCRNCHAEIHKKQKRYRINEDGSITPLSDE